MCFVWFVKQDAFGGFFLCILRYVVTVRWVDGASI